MKQLKVDDHYEINQTIGNLDKLNINHNESGFDNNLKDEVTKLASRFSNVKIDKCLESVVNKNFDDYYALYHLDKDFGMCSPQQSPTNLLTSSPLLPVIAAGQHRKSSITTGVVERENSDQTIYGQSSHLDANLLSAAMNTQRRHTFGPESSSTTNLNSTKPPALFLTPPNAGQHIALNSCETNLNIFPSIIPLQNMDLLRPPQVFLMATNNMSRRASDGQANYSNNYLQNLSMDSDENDYSLNDGSNSDLDHQQQPNQLLSPHHNSLYELNNNQYRYSLNDQQQTAASTPSPPLQFQSPLNASFYQQQPTQFQSPSSPYHSPSNQQRGSPYSSLDLKDKNNYLGRKRHSLTGPFDLATRRKVNNVAVTANPNANLNNSNNFCNMNNNLNSGNMNNPQCLPFYRDLNRRRASEGSGQLLQQLTQFRPFGNDLSTPFAVAGGVKTPYTNDLLNFLSNSSINQPKNGQPQSTHQCKPTNANVQKLQIGGLHSLCVSSPPSLQTSPIHQANQINHLQNQAQTQLTYQKSQSPPCQSLQMISEENTNLPDKNKLVDLCNRISILNHNIINLDQQTVGQLKLAAVNNSLPCSPTPFAGHFPITPPQRFRTPANEACLITDEQQHNLSRHLQQQISYIENQHQLNTFSTPSISITDERGDIIPAPKPFSTHSTYFDKNQLNQMDVGKFHNQQTDFNTLMQHDHYAGTDNQLNSTNFRPCWKEGEERTSLVA